MMNNYKDLDEKYIMGVDMGGGKDFTSVVVMKVFSNGVVHVLEAHSYISNYGAEDMISRNAELDRKVKRIVDHYLPNKITILKETK